MTSIVEVLRLSIVFKVMELDCALMLYSRNNQLFSLFFLLIQVILGNRT